jgi:hypothetical protein
VKKGADGGPVDVVVGELSEGKDFLSFGAVDCGDLVCVLDHQGVDAVLAQAASKPGAQQSGAGVLHPGLRTGQHHLHPGSTTSEQSRAGDELPAAGARPGHHRRDLQDPAKCQAYFDNNRSPFFCSRGDGGS